MSAALDRLDRAALVRDVMEIRERCDRLLDVLLPGDDTLVCPHPADKIVDDSTMDDHGELYRCTLCHATSHTPFHHS